MGSRLREVLRGCSLLDDTTDELLCFDEEMDDEPVDDALDALSKNGKCLVSSFLTAKTLSLAMLGGLYVPLLITLGKASASLLEESCGDFLFKVLGRNWPLFKNLAKSD